MLYLLEQKGLKPESYNTVLSKHFDYPWDNDHPKPTIPTYMGMSLEIRETPFGKLFGHGGNNGDFKSKFEVYKDLKMGYVMFTNSSTSDALLENLRMFLIEGKDKQQLFSILLFYFSLLCLIALPHTNIHQLALERPSPCFCKHRRQPIDFDRPSTTDIIG
ncbi:hypothetical protein [Niastella sp. OAS944]|uniref:hypothetical protein n=1 Tax=Niastella sp. OAS944 TaxID=2664089 RepID=UPI0035C85626|nr:hypothetical protein [Chitinophagaceae bacterium OAS944]